MKKRFLLFGLLCCFFMQAGIGQSIVDQYMDTYKDQKELNQISISGEMFKMMADAEVDGLDAEVKDLIENISSLRILSGAVDGAPILDGFKAKIDGSPMSLLMTIQENGEDVYFYSLDEDKDSMLEELVLVVLGKDNVVMMDIKGRVSLDQVSKLSKTMNIGGSEYLERLKNK